MDNMNTNYNNIMQYPNANNVRQNDGLNYNGAQYPIMNNRQNGSVNNMEQYQNMNNVTQYQNYYYPYNYSGYNYYYPYSMPSYNVSGYYVQQPVVKANSVSNECNNNKVEVKKTELKWWEKPIEEKSKIPDTPLMLSSTISFAIKKPNIQKRLDVFENINKKKIIGKNSPEKNSKKPIPESLRDYVKKCFSACPNGHEKIMEERMRNFLTNVIKNGTAFTKNWDEVELIKIEEVNNKKVKNKKKKHNKNMKKYKDEQNYDKNIMTNMDTNKLFEKNEQLGEVGKRVSEISLGIKNKNGKKIIQECNEIIDINKKKSRLERFKTSDMSLHTNLTNNMVLCNKDKSDNNLIIGTSKALEKMYLRLTTEADVETVRCEKVLKESFKYVMKKYEMNQNYNYICEQFKSIRQDLTIQGIKNEFTVMVYEENARIALKNNDRGEFNQCQTCLKQLYKDNVKGNVTEFLVYNILYLIYTDNHAELVSTFSSINSDLISTNKDIAICYKLYQSLCMGNMVKFLHLYKLIRMECAKAILDMFIDKIRMNGMRQLINSFLPNVSCDYLAKILSFENKDELISWMKRNKICIKDDEINIECKSMRSQLSKL